MANRIDFRTNLCCPHCNTPAFFEPAISEIGQSNFLSIWRRSDNEHWWIGECPSCREPVLIMNNGAIVFPYEGYEDVPEEVPEGIREVFDEAKLCYSVNAYRASAAMSRRALEMACDDHECSGVNLKAKIDKLQEKGLITATLHDMAHEIRFTGNEGAHPKVNDVDEEDASDVLDFTAQILNVLYVAPSRAVARKTKKGR